MEILILQEAIEVLISCSAMAVLKKGDKQENDQTSDDSWEKLKRGGLIGAAAITGGTLMAITGGTILICIDNCTYCFPQL